MPGRESLRSHLLRYSNIAGARAALKSWPCLSSRHQRLWVYSRLQAQSSLGTRHNIERPEQSERVVSNNAISLLKYKPYEEAVRGIP